MTRVTDPKDLTAEEPGEIHPSTGASNGSDVAVSIPIEASSDAAVTVPIEASDAADIDPTEDPVEGDTYEDDDVSQPLPPESMFFSPTEYTKVCKIGRRCQLGQTVAMIEKFDAELRYSMKEHALLTGLDCNEYPKNLENIGSLKFVMKMFGRTDKIKIKDVEEKLEEFKDYECVARKKLTILLFLCKVLKADSKVYGRDPESDEEHERVSKIKSSNKLLWIHYPSLAGKEQDSKKKKTRNQKRKHSGATIETGKKRPRKDWKFKEEPFTSEGKGQKGKGQKGKRRQKK
ncbi:hypothetical protein ISN45_Aa04g008780 [Arabidopsis thaliana x Arabidopsis arenosa]|uniref:Uncharacterized protein n=1 Tax=Arabidopsis thaliana x Arabidopsis arenosa TaxID=1240361 RepID=A0A8T2A8L3_9BRAS|nr:hypothetical protein ISN45_Aa04g008780 [Arabidopsis thaliana x Arabidopsis arenosa]